MLTITHTHEAGTLIEGTTRDDGSSAILKANGWRWGRSIAQWYLPHTREPVLRHRPMFITDFDRDASHFIHDGECVLIGEVIADIDRQAIDKRRLLHESVDRRTLRARGWPELENAFAGLDDFELVAFLAVVAPDRTVGSVK